MGSSRRRALMQLPPEPPITYTGFYVEDVSGNPNTLTFKALYASWTPNPALTIETSPNGRVWTVLGTTSTTPLTTVVPPNTKLFIRCRTNQWTTDNRAFNTITMSDWHNVGGNIMSLLYGEDYTGDETTFPDTSSSIMYILSCLFYNNTKLLSAEKLILPAKNASNRCYSSMFWGCTNLLVAPELTATSVDFFGYNQIFQNCTSLKKAPKIHATLIGERSMEAMFYGCTSLEEAPYVLPGIGYTDVRKYSWYYFLFGNCTSLKKAPIIPISTPRIQTLQQMFNGCTSLEEVKCLATDVSYNNCTYNWLNNVAANGTFIKHPDMNSWGSGASGIPSGWTIVDGTIYDSPVAYLENGIGSYVETGITPNQNYRFECEFKLKGTLGSRSHYVFGSCTNDTYRSIGLFVSDNGNSFLVHYNGEAEIGSCTTDTWYRIVQDKNDITIYNEDSTINATYQFGTSSVGCPYQMVLFAMNYNGTPTISPQPVEIRKFKMIDGNGNTVADYIPVRIGDFGFFCDKATHNLIGRSGWGGDNFIFGDNIYDAQVEYLESSGDQYIDTGLYMNQDSKLILEYQGFTNKYLISGCRNSTTSQGFEFSNGGYGGSTWQDYFIQYGGTYAVLANSCPNDENWHTLEMTNEVYVDGSLIHTFNRVYIGQFTTPLTFLLFAMQSNTYRTLYGYMRIKKAQIYDGNNQLVLDAIAVRKNGVGEMYDRVTGQLLTRQGTFIIGSDIN